MADLLYMKTLLNPCDYLSRGPIIGFTPTALTRQEINVELVSNVALTPVLAWQYAPDCVGATSIFRYQLMSLADLVSANYGAWIDVVGPFNATSPATMTRVVSSIIKIIPTGNMLTQNGTNTIAVVPDGVGSSTFVYSKSNIDTLKYSYTSNSLEELFCLYLRSKTSFMATPVFTTADTVLTGYMVSDGVNSVKYSAQITSVIEYIPSSANTSLVPQDYTEVSSGVMTTISKHLKSGYISQNSLIGNFALRKVLDFQLAPRGLTQKKTNLPRPQRKKDKKKQTRIPKKDSNQKC